MLRLLSVFIVLSVLFSACESDFQLTGEYQETPLIYGIIDPLDNPNAGGDGHVFRVQKSFLGEASAFLMAAEADSSYYRVSDVRVELVEYDEQNELDRWELDTITVFDKDTGDLTDNTIDFFAPAQRLYRTPNNMNVDPDLEYAIQLIRNGSDSVLADSRIELVDPTTFRWNTPSENSNVAQRMTLVNSSGQYGNYNIRFDAASGAKLYEIWFRFWYREVLNGEETLKKLEWRVSQFTLNGETSRVVPISAQNFYNFIGTNLEPIPGVIRTIGRADGDPEDEHEADGNTQDVDIIIRMAGEDLYDYIDINDVSNSGALQDRPVFSNITNGLGVFSSRSTVTFENRVYLSQESAQQLVSGEFTEGLGFVIDPD